MKTKNKSFLAVFVFVLCAALLAVLPFTASAAEGEVAITAENFPNEVFRTYVSANFDSDKNGVLSAEEIANVTEINVYDKAISDLTGIKYFTSLTTLDCSHNNSLESLDVSGCTALTTLYCQKNSLTSLDVSALTSLTMLDCSHNNSLESLDVSGCTALTTLCCQNNSLTSLDVSALTSLTMLDCSYNNSLESLDVSGCTALTTLYCSDSSLTSLDVSGCTALTTLYCQNNSFTSLDVSALTSLETLNCSYTGITSLDVRLCSALTELVASGCTSLTTLLCSDIGLDYLIVTDCTSLKRLDCSGTNIGVFDTAGLSALEELDISGCAQIKSIEFEYPCTQLKWFDCSGTGLRSLDVSNLTELTYLNFSNSEITGVSFGNDPLLETLNCSNTGITSLDVWYLTSLKNLNVSGCTALESLSCSYIGITSLDVSKCTELKSLRCDNTKLTSLDLSSCVALTELYCQYTKLTSLDLSKCTELTTLHCYSTNLTSLDVSKCTELTTLFCDDTKLTSLDLSANAKLTLFNCDLTKTDITINKQTMSYTMPAGFDGAMAEDVVGGVLNGDVLTVNEGAATVTYKYNTGNGEYMLEITLTVTNQHTHTYGEYTDDGETGHFQLCTDAECSKRIDGVHEYASDCDMFCEKCNRERTPLADHTLVYAPIGGNEHSVTCSACAHSFENDCAPEFACAELCSVCGGAYTSATAHSEVLIANNDGTHYTHCTVCGKNGENIACTYGETADDAFLKTPANCTNSAVYYKSCECGHKSEETFTYGAPVPTAHIFGTTDICTLCGVVNISGITFPDEIFREYVSANFDGDRNGVLSAEEIAAATEINVAGMGISSLVGIEHFTALTTLDCQNNHITSLDLSKNKNIKTCTSSGQTVTITIDQKTMTYTMPAGFNSVKVIGSVTGGSFSGAVLTVNEGATEVTYTYGLSSGFFSMTVTLTVENHHTHSYDATTHTCECGKGEDDHTFGENHECTCGATNHTFDATTHECACGATNHSYDPATHKCTCGATNHTFDETTHYCTCGVLAVNEGTFPDEVFRKWILAQTYGQDGVLTAEEIASVTYINVSDKLIKNLKGIEYFTELTALVCYENNSLNCIDISKNIKITSLDCSDCDLQSLDISKLTALEYLYCNGNNLTSLDVSNNVNLKTLMCHNNNLTILDLSNNLALTRWNLGNQTVNITINPDATYTMPAGFDSANLVSNKGGVFNGNVLKAADGETTVTYTYATGFKGANITVTVTVENPHTHSFNEKHECICGANNHSFNEKHECTCGATENHSYDPATHECACGAITGHSYDETTHICACGTTNHSFNEKHECTCGVTNHSYDSVTHTCSCGVKLAEAVQVSLTLGGDIGVNFYWILSEDVINDPEAYFLVTLPNGDQNTILVSKATQGSPVGETTLYYKITGLVAAKEMADDVTVELYYGGAATVSAQSSVRAYAERVFAFAKNGSSAVDEELVAMMKAMLNYGAASQNLFGYKTDNLANSILAEEDKAVAPVDKAVLTPVSMEGSVAGFTPVQFSCVLESTTTIRHYFKVEGDISDYLVFYIDPKRPELGRVVEAELTEDGTMYYVDIPDIPANLISINYIFGIQKDTETRETMKIHASVHSYMLAVLNNSEDEALINTINAMYAYGEAAKAYFAQ